MNNERQIAALAKDVAEIKGMLRDLLAKETSTLKQEARPVQVGPRRKVKARRMTAVERYEKRIYGR
jgi:hypothetical protein